MTEGNTWPKLHNAMWPGLVGKGGDAGELVRAVFEFARGAGIQVRPACSYAAMWVHKHKQYADLVV